VSFFVFFFGLLELNLVDLYASSLMVEGGVEGEVVCGVNVAACWMLFQWPEFRAGK
jgi:hypothetical protein